MQLLDRFFGAAILGWENRLSRRDPHRRVTDFAWGWEWLREISLGGNGNASFHAALDDLDERAPLARALPALARWNRETIAASERFFSYPPVRDYRLESRGADARLRFSSPVVSRHGANNTVTARWFRAAGDRAVVVLPQWNADEEGHVGLCRILRRAGIACLRLSLPYHDARKPPELANIRAEYTVDPNLGRTIHAARQAVCDVRACLDWLEAQGYGRLGIVGTSLGSCYALLASAHEPRLRVNVFNHVSQYFGDVVWTGLATRHVRESIHPYLDQASLREAWRAISPAAYLERFARLASATGKRNLLIYARYDPCFLPEFSREVLAEFARLGIHRRIVELPCGHYTLGRAPFKFADALAITRFLRREL